MDKNIDGLLAEAAQLPESMAKSAEETLDNASESSSEEAPGAETLDESNEKSEESKAEATTPLDEYGNPIEKPRVYTEEEVNRMMRDRFKRGNQPAQQPMQQQPAADGFKFDPDSGDSWEVQLEKFVDHVADKRDQRNRERQWQQEQTSIQADFEAKFTSGMQRYKDFNNVVDGKPLTDAMMLGIRNMGDPAAFIYAACKLQPQEVERIANIRDPYQQSAELGRLEERMKRVRQQTTQAAKIITPVKGDAQYKTQENRSIDDLIQSHAKSKLR